jgi:hypothetical protein
MVVFFLMLRVVMAIGKKLKKVVMIWKFRSKMLIHYNWELGNKMLFHHN